MGTLLQKISTDSVTLGFAITIATLFFIAVGAAVAARFGPESLHNRLYRFVQSAPGLMTTIGVLGTFWGILYGLIEFDVTHIDLSVPHLLEGMKIAFITSVLGMGAAAIFRVSEATGRAIFGSYPLRGELDDPVAQLAGIREAVDRQTIALIGESEGSILGTLKHNRLENLDGFKAIKGVIQTGFNDQISAFRDFADHMRDNTSKTLIEALQEVIRDFNTKLTEQFGDNFKQLNLAVGQLVAWQDRYRAYVEELELRHKSALAAMEHARDILGQIAEKTAKLPEVVQAMKEAADVTLKHLYAQHQLLDGIARVRVDAEEALPKIEQNILRLTNGLKNTVDEMSNTLQLSVTTMNTELRQAIDHTQSAISGSFETFDKQMQQELTRVLTEMGSKLASLSRQFVSDYTPLTQQLQRLISLANGGRVQ